MRRSRRGTVAGRLALCVIAAHLVVVLVVLVMLESPARAAAAATGVTVPLPVLPPPHVRYPGLFDENGCALLHREQDARVTTMCPAPGPTPVALLPSQNEAPWRRLLGYEGPYYSPTVRGSGVSVMPESVGISASDRWGAVGLVRNDTLSVVTDLIVVAQLLGRDGTVVATASASVPVRGVRPGEPAPFAISTTALRSAIARVRWSVRSRPTRPSAASARMVEIALARSLALDDGAGCDASNAGLPIRQAKRTTPPYREIAWGSLKSWSARSIRRPSVVGMWLDAQGRGVMLLPGLVARRRGDVSRPRSALKRGEIAEFVLFLPPRPPAEPRGPAPQRVALWETES